MSSFNNRAKAQQLIDFEGLKFGLCKATDIDISFDWQGKTFVFVELKSSGAPLTAGQKYHLQYLVDAIKRGGKEAFAILAHHETPVDEDFYAASTFVTAVYNGNTWEYGDSARGVTLKETLDELYEQHQKENYGE
jgi:hypothetical protein